MSLGLQRAIVVTGACGFIGRHVARCAARQGMRVLGIGHGAWDETDWRAWGLDAWVHADVTATSLAALNAAPDAIIHCAGSGSVGASQADPAGAYERSVGSLQQVLRFVADAAPVCRVVFPSSAGIYGQTTQVPTPETAPVQPISIYGEHKSAAETMLRESGVAGAIVRLFSVYGAGLRKQLLWDACGKLARGDSEFMGTGDEVRDWLHVEDAASLLLTAAEMASRECPVVNGGSGVGVAVRDVVSQLRDGVAAGSTIGFSGAQRAGDPDRFIADIARAGEWGWQPQRAWRDGVAEYAAWWMGLQK